MATIAVTVSFGEKDLELWEYIERRVGKPVTSMKIRGLLHELMVMDDGN